MLSSSAIDSIPSTGAIARVLPALWQEESDACAGGLLHPGSPQCGEPPVASGGGELKLADLPPELRSGGSAPRPSTTPARASSGTMQDAEREAIVVALERCSGNVTEAAKNLGIGRATLYRKLTKYGIAR